MREFIVEFGDGTKKIIEGKSAGVIVEENKDRDIISIQSLFDKKYKSNKLLKKLVLSTNLSNVLLHTLQDVLKKVLEIEEGEKYKYKVEIIKDIIKEGLAKVEDINEEMEKIELE